MENSTQTQPKTQSEINSEFASEARAAFGVANTEISERNEEIRWLDDYIYSNRLELKADIPVGHDMMPVNWLRRTVEIHKNMFMGRGFQLISTYDSQDEANAPDEDEKGRIRAENAKQKAYAETRKNLIDAIIRDNDGDDFWTNLAEDASAVGTAAIKAYYDEDENKYVLSPLESIENMYVLWGRDDFRSVQAVAFAYQVTKEVAIRDFGAAQDVAMSPLGQPMGIIADGKSSSTQPMVTIMEITGTIQGWGSENGKLKRVTVGKENRVNAKLIGNDVKRLLDDQKKLPKYYILPNKRQRRRAWGVSDISKEAIYINLAYIETYSDWRTHSRKVNFQKYKAFGFGTDTQMPKSESRTTQTIGLAEGQDIQRLDQGDSNGADFKAQMDECQAQFVRETGISRVLLDDPSVTLNSNQALLTSMKPTSDIAEAKKRKWAPIIVQIFEDALETLGMHDPAIKEAANPKENWSLKVAWPSLMQKEDPVYQQMLLNRINAKTMSIQSYLEAQSETKEEIDRIRDEMTDPVTAAIHGNQMPLLAQGVINPVDPNAKPEPEVKHTFNWRMQPTPQQEANIASTVPGFQDGPFGMSMGPQGSDGDKAQMNLDNRGFLTGDPNKGGTAITRGPDGQEIPNPPVKQNQPGVNSNGGTGAPAQVATQANNTPGAGVVSQPGSGATTTSPQGAINQEVQNNGG